MASIGSVQYTVKERPTVADPAAEFQSLLDQRELAAVRVVGAVDSVISFWEAQDYDTALAVLKHARDEYNAADRRISEFHKSLKGENTRHGNSTAA